MLGVLLYIFFLPVFVFVACGVLHLLGIRARESTEFALGILLSGIVDSIFVSENTAMWLLGISTVLALCVWLVGRKESQNVYTAKQQVKQQQNIGNSNSVILGQTSTANAQLHPAVKASTTGTRRAETVPYPNYLDYENCMYCHQPVTSATAYFLSNGMKLHKDCYNRCVGNSGIVEKDVIGKAHAFWPGYPPDWDNRKAGVLREANHRCQICGRSGVPLDVHHIVSITDGGTNEFVNLRAICRNCHQEEHPDHDLGRDFDNTSKQIKDTVYSALSQKRELYTVYEDKYHNITERRVRPKRVIDRYGKKILIAYCYMRNEDNREFRLERMHSARITY